MNELDMNHVAEVELVYRNKVKASDRPQIKDSHLAYRYLLNSWDTGKIEFVEQFKIMLLNRACRLLGILDISTGGTAGTFADPKLVFSAALKANASAIILAHNHPSGNLKPSQPDIRLTDQLRQAGRLLEIEISDHLIVSNEGYFSFSDEGV